MLLRLPFNGDYPLTQGFGENPGSYARFNLLGHNGLDWGLPVHTPIVVVDDGEVVEVLDDPPGFGRYVKVRHAWGESLYAHLEQPLARVGQKVGRGHLIGMSGNSGNSTGPHLHFGLRVAPYDRADGWQGYCDPAPYFVAPVGAVMGPHIIGSIGPHVAVLREWQPRLITVLDPSPDEMRALRAVCPRAVIVGRVYRDDGEVQRRIADSPEQAAAWAHAAVLGRFAPEVDYWQVANEVMQDWGGLPFLSRFEVERMRLAEERGYKCAILAFSVGNPDMPEHDRMALWRQVTPALQAAEAGGHVVAVHQYGKPNLWSPDADWFIHRLEHQVLPRLSLKKLRFVVTEYGIDGLIWSQDGRPAGWSTFTNAADYADQLVKSGQYVERFRGRVLGYAIFTLGNNAPWQTYDIAGDVARRLAAPSTPSTGSGDGTSTGSGDDGDGSNGTDGTDGGNGMGEMQGNQAGAYGVTVKAADARAGERRWKAILIRHLPPDENRSRHHVFVDALDEHGQRAADPKLRIGWTWVGRRSDERADPVRLDKPANEPMGNVPMNSGQIMSISMLGDGIPSDLVHGMHTKWPDEMGSDGVAGNTMGHHSFQVVFQRVASTGSATDGTGGTDTTNGDNGNGGSGDNKELSAQVAQLRLDVAALQRWQKTVTVWLEQLQGEL